jgi:pimeloyl-CoA synthetase
MMLLTICIIFAILLAVGSYYTGYYAGKTAGYEHAIRMMKDEKS